MVEAKTHEEGKRRGCGARSREVGRDHHGEKAWLGLQRPGSWAPKWQDKFGPGTDSTWDLDSGKMRGTLQDLGLPKGPKIRRERRGREVEEEGAM
jgi:hypothetical protein